MILHVLLAFVLLVLIFVVPMCFTAWIEKTWPESFEEGMFYVMIGTLTLATGALVLLVTGLGAYQLAGFLIGRFR